MPCILEDNPEFLTEELQGLPSSQRGPVCSPALAPKELSGSTRFLWQDTKGLQSWHGVIFKIKCLSPTPLTDVRPTSILLSFKQSCEHVVQ